MCPVKVRERELVTYSGLVSFASSLTDSLLFVHYTAVLLLEVRHRVQEQFYIKVHLETTSQT